jgi:hypothetical protein
LDRRSYVGQDFVYLDRSVIRWTGVCYVIQDFVMLYRSVLRCTGVCKVVQDCVKLDLNVLHWTGGIAKLDSSVLSSTVVCYVGQ